MNVNVEMPGGDTESVSPGSVLVIRNALSFEKMESPEVKTMIWIGGSKIYPSERLKDLQSKFDAAEIPFAELTAPNGMTLLVSMKKVVNCKVAAGELWPESASSVLRFGSGPMAPRQAVRETKEELVLIWRERNQVTDPFD